VASVKQRAKEQSRKFAFFDVDETGQALKALQAEEKCIAVVAANVASCGPSGQPLELDLRKFDQPGLRAALDRLAAVVTTLDGKVG
jgi:hypothetical protein